VVVVLKWDKEEGEGSFIEILGCSRNEVGFSEF
jgi:hypothetical protein